MTINLQHTPSGKKNIWEESKCLYKFISFEQNVRNCEILNGWLQLDRARQNSNKLECCIIMVYLNYDDLTDKVMYNTFFLSCYLCFASSEKMPNYIIKIYTFLGLGVGLSKM